MLPAPLKPSKSSNSRSPAPIGSTPSHSASCALLAAVSSSSSVSASSCFSRGKRLCEHNGSERREFRAHDGIRVSIAPLDGLHLALHFLVGVGVAGHREALTRRKGSGRSLGPLVIAPEALTPRHTSNQRRATEVTTSLGVDGTCLYFRPTYLGSHTNRGKKAGVKERKC